MSLMSAVENAHVSGALRTGTYVIIIFIVSLSPTKQLSQFLHLNSSTYVTICGCFTHVGGGGDETFLLNYLIILNSTP